MADVLLFEGNARNAVDPLHYSVDISLYSKNIEFVVSGVQTDAESKRKVADELERIARIIRTDVVIEGTQAP